MHSPILSSHSPIMPHLEQRFMEEVPRTQVRPNFNRLRRSRLSATQMYLRILVIQYRENVVGI